jgi:hypothetical protein
MRTPTSRAARSGLRPLTLVLLRAHRLALRRPRTVLLLAALLAVAMAAATARGRLALSIREMVDPDVRSSRWQAEMDAEFGGGHPVVVFFSRGEAGLGAGDLTAIRAFVERERAGNPEVVAITTPWDALRASRIDGRLRLVPVLDADAPESLARLADTPWGGVLTDARGRDVAVELVFRDTPGRSFFGRFDPRPVGALLSRARAEVGGARPGIDVRLAGVAAFEWHALVAQNRFNVLNVFVLVLLFVLLRAFLGTWRSGLVLGLVIGWAGALVYGGMALTGMPIDMLSAGLFLMLAVAAIEDGLFLSWERLTNGGPWRRAFRTLLLPGFLTSLTTVIGFASLCAADLAIVRRFGLWGATGAALEWVATFVVLPALLAVAPPLRVWTDRARALPVGAAQRLLGRRLPRWAARAALLVLALAGFGAAHLDYTDSPLAVFPDGHPYREATAYAERTRGWVGELHVVFPEDASMREVAAFSRELEGAPGVTRVLDPASVLAFWTRGDPLALFELAPELRGARAGGLTGRTGRLRAAVFVSDAHLATMIALRDAVLRRFPDGDGFPAGELVSYAEFGEIVPRTLLHSLGTCLVLVGLVIAFLYRAVGLGWGVRAAVASAWGPAVAVVIVWATRMHVNFLTCVFASVLVGLCGDNAVQFACAARRSPLRAGIDRRAGAALLVAVVMGLCALTFLGSAFAPPRMLGVLLASGLLAALMGDVWILGALAGGDRRRGVER